MSDLVYLSNAEYPSAQLTWKDSAGNLIDFSTGYTFTVKLAQNGTTVVTKTAGITGAATAPNVTIAWDLAELNITPGVYEMFVYARDAASKDRAFRPGNPPTIQIVGAPS